jgi:hypothetical protein
VAVRRRRAPYSVKDGFSGLPNRVVWMAQSRRADAKPPVREEGKGKPLPDRAGPQQPDISTGLSPMPYSAPEIG